jgi:hypothetical protein
MDDSFWNANSIHRKTLWSNPVGGWLGGRGHLYQCASIGDGGGVTSEHGIKSNKSYRPRRRSRQPIIQPQVQISRHMSVAMAMTKVTGVICFSILIGVSNSLSLNFYNWTLNRVHTIRTKQQKWNFYGHPDTGYTTYDHGHSHMIRTQLGIFSSEERMKNPMAWTFSLKATQQDRPKNFAIVACRTSRSWTTKRNMVG